MEIASFAENNNQLVGTPNQDECVAFGCATIYYSGPPNGQPSGNADAIRASANYWYARETGDPSSSAGLSVPQEYDILNGLGLKYVGLPIDGNSQHADDIAHVKEWLSKGLPVLICGVEDDFFDILDGDQIPYGWRINANHAIVASGIAPDGNLYVRDYLNVSLPGVVPGCRRIYDINKMRLVSGTAVYPKWYTGGNMPVPTGWKDDGHTLTAPNGHRVVLGFRDHILNSPWNSYDQPLEEEGPRNPLEENNPSLGAGQQQLFEISTLEYTPAKGVFLGYTGQELQFVRANRDALKAQVAALQAEIAALKAASPVQPGQTDPLLASVKTDLEALIAKLP